RRKQRADRLALDLEREPLAVLEHQLAAEPPRTREQLVVGGARRDDDHQLAAEDRDVDRFVAVLERADVGGRPGLPLALEGELDVATFHRGAVLAVRPSTMPLKRRRSSSSIRSGSWKMRERTSPSGPPGGSYHCITTWTSLWPL